MTTASQNETVATTTKEVLVAAKWILENVGWCQNASMVDKEGKFLDVYSEKDIKRAAAFCISGALIAVRIPGGIKSHGLVTDARYALEQVIGSRLGVVSWNDRLGRTKEEVIALFSKTIENCK